MNVVAGMSCAIIAYLLTGRIHTITEPAVMFPTCSPDAGMYGPNMGPAVQAPATRVAICFPAVDVDES